MQSLNNCVQIDADSRRGFINSSPHEGCKEVFGLLSSAKSFYPDFEDWFYGKVLTGIDCGERRILREYSSDGCLAGIAILKITPEESKLCNLTILPEFQNRGFGVRLFDRVFTELDTKKPFLTVSEEKYTEFKRLFDYYEFKVTDVKDSLYRSGKVEYFLNEPLSSLI